MSNDSAVMPETKLNGLMDLMRPKHFVKNGFVLAPILFAGQFTDTRLLLLALEAFLLFCIAASSVYVLNDLLDAPSDRCHPKKRFTRPIASGAVSKPQAIALLVVLYLALALAATVRPLVVAEIAVYILLNFAYSYKLKHLPIWDIFCVASGFVLRVLVGATAISVPLSSWMFITTLCLALYLAALKRRQELLVNGSNSRKVLEQYSSALVDRYAEMAATGALLFYSLFVMTARPELVVTIPIVLFGIFRYWLLVENSEAGESPTEALLTDKQLMGTLCLWVAVCVWQLSGIPDNALFQAG